MEWFMAGAGLVFLFMFPVLAIKEFRDFGFCTESIVLSIFSIFSWGATIALGISLYGGGG